LIQRHVIDLILIVVAMVCIGLAIFLYKPKTPRRKKRIR
jgi:hypothetical protein